MVYKEVMKNIRSPKSVFVTGAQGALGKHVVSRFLEAGCKVWGADLRIQDPTLFSKNSAGSMQWLEMDASSSASVRSNLPQDVEAWIHCAGGFRFAKTDEVSDEDLDFLINANLRSAFLIAREILPGMKRRGFGRIVFVGARATLAAGAGMGPYSASKAGLNMLVSSLAEEVKPYDINVNAVLPSIIDTPANRKDMPDSDFAKWVAPEELAEILFSLTQPLSRSIHGALIPVSGRV